MATIVSAVADDDARNDQRCLDRKIHMHLADLWGAAPRNITSELALEIQTSDFLQNAMKHTS